MKNTILKAVDVCKSFANDGVQNHVLNMVNLDINEGDFTVIMGSSGSGKSTLLYSLSCMDSITSGKVFYKGAEISGMKENKLAAIRAKEFGFVFQQTHLVSNLTLFENVAVTGYLDKTKSGKQVKERADLLLEQVNVSTAKKRLPMHVSGGEAQRAAIARALINEPGIIFADEPTGALNKSNTQDILHLLTKINSTGQSILMVTHDVRAAVRATRLLYLEDGKIIGEMQMPPYTHGQKQSRAAQVDSWLSSMKW